MRKRDEDAEACDREQRLITALFLAVLVLGVLASLAVLIRVAIKLLWA